MDFKIDSAIEKDENFQKGYEEFNRIEQKANKVAEELSATLVESIIKNDDGEKFNLSTAIMAVAKTLTHLASYMYDTEEEFLTDVKKGRTAVVSDVIPALLDPQPCGLCEECKNGNPEFCLQPNVRGDHTTSRFLPVLANMLIEYDMFNKIIYMHTAGKIEEQPVETKESTDFDEAIKF